MFEAIGRVCKGYYDELPSDILQKVGKSGLYSFTVVFIRVPKGENWWNVRDPLFAAGITALASLIHGLTIPIFNKIFGNNELKFHQETIKQLVVCYLTFVLINYITTSKVNLLSVKVFQMMSTNFLKTLLNIYPASCDWLDAHFFPNQGYHEMAQKLRTILRLIGLGMEPRGESSIYFACAPLGTY